MTQQDLAAAVGVNERAVRFWERKRDRKPTSAPNDARIEQVLTERGVILFADPTPGVRLAVAPARPTKRRVERPAFLSFRQ